MWRMKAGFQTKKRKDAWEETEGGSESDKVATSEDRSSTEKAPTATGSAEALKNVNAEQKRKPRYYM